MLNDGYTVGGPSVSSQSLPRNANNILDGWLESLEEDIGNSPLILSLLPRLISGMVFFLEE